MSKVVDICDIKPGSKRKRRLLLAKEPQVIEGPKKALLLYGRQTSEKVRTILSDLYKFKVPNVVKLTRKNDLTLFEDCTPLENLLRKSDCSLFMLASHSKKRPDNIIMGRFFHNSLLDMIELNAGNFKPFKDFTEGISLYIKPCLVFSGSSWDLSEELSTLRSILIDFFHREKVDAVRLQGLEHVLSFTATTEGNILFRSYKVLLKKSGNKIPRIELDEIGPQIDFTIRRSKLASEDLMKQACRKPKVIAVRKKKNISRDGLGTTHGRIHVGKQDLTKLQTRKLKGLRNKTLKRKSEDGPSQTGKKNKKNDP